MNCAVHPQTPAAAYCRNCGKALCQACKREIHGVVYCEDCLASRVQGPAAVAAPAVTPTQGPNPVIAALLGFIPGVGAMYCGEFMKGLIHVAVFAALVAAADKAEFVGVLIAFWVFYMVFDSYHTAKAKQMGTPVPDFFGFGGVSRAPSRASADFAAAPPVEVASGSQRLPTGAIVLIAIGGLFMLDNLGLFRFHGMARFWPLLLVALGAYKFIQRRSSSRCQCARCVAGCVMGPAILATVGVMGLLAEFTRAGWDRSWPLILIVIGVVKFLETSGSTAGHVGPGDAASTPTEGLANENEVTHG